MPQILDALLSSSTSAMTYRMLLSKTTHTSAVTLLKNDFYTEN